MENKNELARLWRKASILDDGTVLLGASHEICCDGFDSRSSIGVITHFHTDHIHGLERCLHNLDQVIVSEETRSLLIALKGNYLSYRMNLIPQKFGEPLAVSGGKLTLFPCKHVLGASQVLFENADGDRIVYTGDFDYPSTKPIPSDLLVIDATYGSPDYVHPSGNEKAEKKLVELVRATIQSGLPVYICASNGRTQEIMHLLRENSIGAPFLALEKNVALAKVYESYGKHIGEIYPMKLTADRAIRPLDHRQSTVRGILSDERFIAFFGIHSQPQRANGILQIDITRHFHWNDPNSVMIQYDDDRVCIPLSDHSDFNGVMNYVRQSSPKLVIPKGGDQTVFAREVRERLHIECLEDTLPLPAWASS
jgi:Cft2 family RNA processing exonuclease